MKATTYRCGRCGFTVTLTLARAVNVRHLCLRPRWTDDQWEPLKPAELVPA